MNNLKKMFKSKKFIFAFSLLFTLLIIILRIVLFQNEDYMELIFFPILSLLWGPFAVLGFALAELSYMIIFETQDITIKIINILLILLYGNLLWKLWYSLMNKYEYNIPNLGNLYNIIKIFVIFLIYMIITIIFFRHVTDNVYIYLQLFAPLSIFLTIFILHITNMFKIPLYAPRIQFRKILPDKAYTAILVLALVIGILNDSDLSCILTFVMIMIYMMKPLNEEVFKIKGTTDLNLFNKVSISIFLILTILSLILVFTPHIYLLSNHHLINDFTYEVLIDICDTLLMLFVLFLIPLLIYMYFLEKKVIKPINVISKSLSHEINNQRDFKKIEKNLTSINTNNEIKSLADFLLEMENELIDYGKELMKITSEKERLKTELKLAHDIQLSMIPIDFEEFNERNFEIQGMMKAAREVGGDFYDYFRIDDDNIGFVIGDVSGKGITASLIMVKAMTLIKDHAKHYKDVSKVFYEVNNLLCEGNAENHFVTCWLGKINVKTKELSFVNAGHNPPLIKNSTESFEYLKCESDVVLAIMEDMDYKEHTIQLNKDSSLFLYTDGITEANNNYNGFYGEERLQDILNQNKEYELKDIISNIEKDINEFCDNEEQFDDMTMLIIKLL